jgi:hypothetical protein
MNKNNSDSDQMGHKYFKLWAISIVIITIGYILCYVIINDNMTINELTPEIRLALKSITPSYPPPLIHFMDRSEMKMI